MVGKLFKHDLKEAGRAHVPVLMLILIGTILVSITFRVNMDSLGLIPSLINLTIFALLIAVSVLSVRAVIFVLYTSMYKVNAYRLFTLPVKSWEIICSKVLTVWIWNLLISIATFVGISFIIGVNSNDLFIVFREFPEFLTTVKQLLDLKVLLLVFVDGFFTSLNFILLLLFSGSLAHSSYIHKNRGLLTFLIFLFSSMIITRITALFNADFIVRLLTYSLTSIQSGAIEMSEFFWIFMFQFLLSGFLFLIIQWLWDTKLEII